MNDMFEIRASFRLPVLVDTNRCAMMHRIYRVEKIISMFP